MKKIVFILSMSLLILLICFSVMMEIETYNRNENLLPAFGLSSDDKLEVPIGDSETESSVLDNHKVNNEIVTSELPVIEISVEDSIWPIDRHNYLTGEFSIIFPDNKGNIIEEDITIRARGNSSLSDVKKSYKIKFEEITSPIPNGNAASNWLLIANYGDLTMMRNYYSLEAMQQLDNILFAPDSIFVEVIFNGQYQGVYQLCEPVEFDPARIDIEDSLPILQNGYLIERDQFATFWKQCTKYVEYFEVTGILYNYKSKISHIDQGKYVESIVKEVEDTIYSQNQTSIEAVMDIPSSIDTYLLYEFTKNIDVGWGSFYMYLYPFSEKLYFGTPWDFDMALGNDNRLDGGSYEGLYVGNPDVNITQSHQWYQSLMQQDWYQIKVKDRWNDIKHIFLETNEKVLSLSNNYTDAFNKDQELWGSMALEDNLRPDDIATLTTHEEHISHLHDWINNRYLWLDNYFNHIMLQ